MKSIFLMFVSLFYSILPLLSIESEPFYDKVLSDFLEGKTSQVLKTYDDYLDYFESQINLASFDDISELYAVTDMNLVFVNTIKEFDKEVATDSLRLLFDAWQKKQGEIGSVDKKIRSDYYRACADVFSTSTYFVSSGMKEIVVRSRQAVKMLQDAVRLDPKNARAYLSWGIWSYYSPVIGGGGYENAQKYLEEAIRRSQDRSTTFKSYLWLSQVFFQMKEEDKYQETMRLATSLFPDSPWLAVMKIGNEEGNAWK